MRKAFSLVDQVVKIRRRQNWQIVGSIITNLALLGLVCALLLMR